MKLSVFNILVVTDALRIMLAGKVIFIFIFSIVFYEGTKVHNIYFLSIKYF